MSKSITAFADLPISEKNQEIGKSIIKNEINLTDVLSAAKFRLNDLKIWEIEEYSYHTIWEINSTPTKDQKKRLTDVDNFVSDTHSLKDLWEYPQVSKLGSKQYYSINSKEHYRIISKKWFIAVCYNPLTKTYSTWNVDNNMCMLKSFKKIQKTKNKNYYKIEEKKETKGYYYISDNWDTRYFWNLAFTNEENFYWKTAVLQWTTRDIDRVYMIHNGEEVEEIYNKIADHYQSKSWRNFLLMRPILSHASKPSFFSLFDLENMNYVFHNATDYDLAIEWWKIGDQVSYTHRNKLSRFIKWTHENTVEI